MVVAYKNIFLLEQLKHAFKAGKLHHANLILSGIGGEGLPLAIELSKLLLCDKETGCGSCRGCTRVSRLEHLENTPSSIVTPFSMINELMFFVCINDFNSSISVICAFWYIVSVEPSVEME